MTRLDNLSYKNVVRECENTLFLDEVFVDREEDCGMCKYGKFQSRKYWFGREEKITREQGVPSLPAFILYEHHFKGRNIREIAEDLDSSRQSVLNLGKKLNLPLRSREEASKFMSESIRNKIDKVLLPYGYEVLGMTVEMLARYYEVDSKIISDELKKSGVEVKKGGGNSNFTRGKTYEEIFGEKMAKDIKRRMRKNMKGRISPIKGQTLDGYYGEKRSAEIRKKMSESQKERHRRMRNG